MDQQVSGQSISGCCDFCDKPWTEGARVVQLGKQRACWECASSAIIYLNDRRKKVKPAKKSAAKRKGA